MHPKKPSTLNKQTKQNKIRVILMSWTTACFYKQLCFQIFCQLDTKLINKSYRKTVVHILKEKKTQKTSRNTTAKAS